MQFLVELNEGYSDLWSLRYTSRVLAGKWTCHAASDIAQDIIRVAITGKLADLFSHRDDDNTACM